MIIGRASEFLVAYILELSGLRTVHVDLPYDDLWCSHQDGTLVRVQVKSRTSSSNRSSTGRFNNPRYAFATSNGARYGGVFVFVAQDMGLMLARSWDDVPPQTFRIKREDFTHASQVESIKREFKL
jgi:hypothetical protein